MNRRLTITSAVAVILASCSMVAVIRGAGWFFEGVGAVIVVAVVGSLTRLSQIPAACAVTVIAALAVAPLLTIGNPAGVAGGVAIIAVAAASATRLRLFRVLAVPIAYLGALLWYLNLVFAHKQSLAGIVPTAASLRHLNYLIQVAQYYTHFHAPVPEAGSSLLAAGGIGLVAAMTDLIAVRLRSPAIAGLPLLVLFSVPVTTNAAEGWVAETAAFCLGITGFLALLSADGRERLRIWGRLVTVWHGTFDEEPGRGPDTKALSASGRRVGLAAVCLAVLTPLLVPGLQGHELFHRGTGTGGPGHDEVSLPQPLVQMQRLLQAASPYPVLTYSDSDHQPQYLQIFVLNFNAGADNWTLIDPNPDPNAYRSVRGRGLLAAAPGVTADAGIDRVTTRVSIGRVAGYKGKVAFLPLPYAPARLQSPGDWREDLATSMVYSTDTLLHGLKFTVTSNEANPPNTWVAGAEAGSPPSSTGTYTGYSGPHRRALLKLAQKITRHATSAGQQALELQNWFTAPGRFTYTTAAAIPNSDSGLYKFLTTERRGDCQQFAFAFAVLARLLGIPSRIAVGFTGGVLQKGGKYKVTSADAHSWPELYFAGAGWLRFEPTPGGISGQGTAIPPAYTTQVPTGPAAAKGTQTTPGTTTPSGTTRSRSGGIRFKPGAAGGRTGSGGRAGHHGAGNAFPYWLAAAIVVALAAIGPRASRSLIRQRRWRSARGDAGLAHAAWQELRDDLIDFGIGVRPSESPRAVANRIGTAQELPEAARAALRRVASAEERARYAAEPIPAGPLRADVTLVRRALARRASRRTRWQARLAPPSMTNQVRAALRSTLDIFGWLDAVRLRVRRHPGGEFAR
jgi:transglutaminase-like putative cysteine protease